VQPASAACQQFPRVGAAEHVCKTSRGSAPRKRVHGSRLAPPTPEAPDHAVYDAFIRRSVRARYPGCAPREATSRRTNAKQFLFWAERDQLTVIGLVLRDMDVVRLSARHPALAAWQHIASGSISLRAAHRFGLKALISPALQVGRHRAMAGLSTMTHATMNATHATSILVPPPLPRLEKKAVPQKWGKYDEFVSCARRYGGIGVLRRFADTRIALVANPARKTRKHALQSDDGCFPFGVDGVNVGDELRRRQMRIAAGTRSVDLMVNADAASATRESSAPPASSSPPSPSRGR
jgi:hypothetical protein